MTTATPQPSAVRSIFTNLAKLMGGKLAAGVISLIYMAIAARMLGVAGYGALNLVHGYAVFIGGLVAFSGFHGVVSYGAAHLRDGTMPRLRQLVIAMTLIELAMAALAWLVFIAAFNWAMLGMDLPPQIDAFRYIYAFAILATVRATPHGLLQLADRFDLISVHQAIMPLVRLIGVLIVWAGGGGLTAFVWVWLAGAVAEGLSMWLLAGWVWRGRITGDDSRFGWQALRDQNPGLLRFIATTNVDLTMREFAPKAMPLIIGWVAGPAATGLFVLAHRISAVFYQPAQMLGQAGYSIIARLITGKDWGATRSAVWRSAGMATAASLAVAAVMSLFAAPLLKLVGGAGFAAGASLLIIIAFARALAAGGPTYSAALTALGKPGQSVTANTASNLLTLPLLPPMLGWLSIEGAGWHVMLQSLILMAILHWGFARQIKTQMSSEPSAAS